MARTLADPHRCFHVEGDGTQCEYPAISQAYFCTRHIGEPHQCRMKRRSTGEQCRQTARKGTIYCAPHGRSPYAKKASERALVLTQMQRFVKPYEGDIDPLSAFEMEFRRTLGRIAWYDEQLALLGSERDLIWGVTKEEHVGAAEFAGTNTTYEAKANLLLELQNWERKHLLDMEKVWIGAKLDEQKLNLMRRYVESAYTAVVKAVKILGLDPGDPKVQEALAVALLGEEAAHASRGPILANEREVPALPPALPEPAY